MTRFLNLRKITKTNFWQHLSFILSLFNTTCLCYDELYCFIILLVYIEDEQVACSSVALKYSCLLRNPRPGRESHHRCCFGRWFFIHHLHHPILFLWVNDTVNIFAVNFVTDFFKLFSISVLICDDYPPPPTSKKCLVTHLFTASCDNMHQGFRRCIFRWDVIFQPCLHPMVTSEEMMQPLAQVCCVSGWLRI